MLSRLVITFLPRSKCLLISWLQSPSAMIGSPKKQSATVSTVSPSICHEVLGPDSMILVLWMLSFKTAFSLTSFPFTKRLFQWPQEASQRASEKSGSLWSWEGPLGTPLGLVQWKRASWQVVFTFCHKGGVICISGVIDISPSNLDSSLCFFQSSVSHDVLCI